MIHARAVESRAKAHREDLLGAAEGRRVVRSRQSLATAAALVALPINTSV